MMHNIHSYSKRSHVKNISLLEAFELIYPSTTADRQSKACDKKLFLTRER